MSTDNDPTRIGAAVPAVLGVVRPHSRARWLGEVNAETARRVAARRDRVLRSPDLAARLLAPPLSYRSPDQWNGFVPPRWWPNAEPELLRSPATLTRTGPSGGFPNHANHRTTGAERNGSARRTALIAICAEADRRAVAAGEPAAADLPDILDACVWLPLAGEQQALDVPGPVQAEVPWPTEPAEDGPPAAASWPQGSIGEGAH